jgi:hypothetical protein
MHACNDELDAELNEALHRYADPAEDIRPADLAARVVAASKEQRANGWTWYLRGPAPVLACLLIFVVVAISYQRHTGSRGAARNPIPLRTTPARRLHSLTSETAAAQVHSHVIRAKAFRPPKLDQFPQPRPLSEQERLMLTFVSTAAPEEQRVVAQAGAAPQFMQVAELQSSVTHPSTLNVETPGESHEEHR